LVSLAIILLPSAEQATDDHSAVFTPVEVQRAAELVEM
jgi:hypothetical protein